MIEFWYGLGGMCWGNALWRVRIIYKYRIAYAKIESARFLSHLEILRTMNRALRRSGLPLAYTEGFNPHPRISFCPPLGVGMAGLNEYLDLELLQPVPLQESLKGLAGQLVQGLSVKGMIALPPSAPGLGKVINCAGYRIVMPLQVGSENWRLLLDELAEGSEPWYYRRPKDGKTFEVKSGVLAGYAATEQDTFLELLVRVGEGEVPLRGILDVFREKAGASRAPLPADITRVGLYRRRDSLLINPLGETEKIWEKKYCEVKKIKECSRRF